MEKKAAKQTLILTGDVRGEGGKVKSMLASKMPREAREVWIGSEQKLTVPRRNR